ncbi:kinesin-like protein KIN-7H [Lotus japonicus]|uniref:kinesin-like protein KIN-7H n=1 Tax=Lotus japonicus TaxID=34305 RepID=UPI0025899B81|nr:kinesin-like protein KIN-7H [Lotus japonicus]
MSSPQTPATAMKGAETDAMGLLLSEMIVFLESGINDFVADAIMNQLLLLDAQDPSKDIKLFINSPGGSLRTAIIYTMSPAQSHVEQSRNTLLFASCAKEVATNAQVNVVMSDKALVKQLQKELARMESELRNSGSARPTSDSAALLREKDLQIEMWFIRPPSGVFE